MREIWLRIKVALAAIVAIFVPRLYKDYLWKNVGILRLLPPLEEIVGKEARRARLRLEGRASVQAPRRRER